MSDSGVLSGYQWSLLSPLMLQRGVLAACRSLLGPRDCAGGPTISPVVGSLLLLELDYQGTKTNGTRTNFQKNKRRQIEGGIEGGGRNVVEGSDGLNAHLLKVAETC